MLRRAPSLMLAALIALSVPVASAPAAKRLSAGRKAKIRAELRKQVKENPGALWRRSFLRKAALVNFKLPVTIRLRNPCMTRERAEPGDSGGRGQNCAHAGHGAQPAHRPDRAA